MASNDSPMPLLFLAGAAYLLWKWYTGQQQPTSTAPPAAASPSMATPADPAYTYQPPMIPTQYAPIVQQPSGPPPSANPYWNPTPAAPPPDNSTPMPDTSHLFDKPNQYVAPASNPPAPAFSNQCKAFQDWYAQWVLITGEVRAGAPPAPTC